MEAIAKFHPELVCISALLTVTMFNIEEVIKAIKEAGLRDQVKIIVGGGPITQSISDKIGADAYVKYGTNAANKARELLQTTSKSDLQENLAGILNAEHQRKLQALLEVEPSFIDASGDVMGEEKEPMELMNSASAVQSGSRSDVWKTPFFSPVRANFLKSREE